MPQEDIQRICYLIANHHTYDSIDGLDYQILVEADFLVNLYEQKTSPEGIRSTLERIFKTQMGAQLCEILFAVNKSQEIV